MPKAQRRILIVFMFANILCEMMSQKSGWTRRPCYQNCRRNFQNSSRTGVFGLFLKKNERIFAQTSMFGTLFSKPICQGFYFQKKNRPNLRAKTAFICPMETTTTTPASSNFTMYEKTVIALLALTQFSVVLDFMVLSPLGDILMKSLYRSDQRSSVLRSRPMHFRQALLGCSRPVLADKYDRKRLLIFFYSGFLIGTFCCGIAQSYPALLAARILTGLFGGVIGSISMAIISDVFELNKRGRVMGTVQMGFAASQVLGIPIGLYLANKWDWHAPFLMIVGLGAATALGIARWLRPVTAHLAQTAGQNFLAHFRHVSTVPRYRIAFSATALMSIGGFLMMPFGSAFFGQ